MNTSPGNIITIEPSVRRLFLLRLLEFAVPILIGYGMRLGTRPSALTPESALNMVLYEIGPQLLVAGFFLLFAVRTRGDRTITIDATTIEGPANSFGKRISLPLARLDRARCLRRPWYHRLLGLRHLWSLDGEKFVIEELSLTEAQRTTLMNALRLGEGAFGYSLD